MRREVRQVLGHLLQEGPLQDRTVPVLAKLLDSRDTVPFLAKLLDFRDTISVLAQLLDFRNTVYDNSTEFR